MKPFSLYQSEKLPAAFQYPAQFFRSHSGIRRISCHRAVVVHWC